MTPEHKHEKEQHEIWGNAAVNAIDELYALQSNYTALQLHAEKLAEALSVLLNSDNIAFMDAGEYDMALTTLTEYEKSKV